ncbi:hypothetical protein T10_1901 [Trichinella papuae]|uniref:Uncharacterized protein n=1 Tax=Trichinella papuae TaxID=268474 RepID=A0A0V1M4R1_9BILA|nr:hypothetical protein T10_1901 [Trichinella papuae]
MFMETKHAFNALLHYGGRNCLIKVENSAIAKQNQLRGWCINVVSICCPVATTTTTTGALLLSFMLTSRLASQPAS